MAAPGARLGAAREGVAAARVEALMRNLMTAPAAVVRVVLGACVLSFALSQIACVSPTQTYRLVDLGPLGCTGTNGCYVGPVNDWCQVTGWDVPTFGADSVAIVWRAGSGPNILPKPMLEYVAGPPPSYRQRTAGPQPTSLFAYDINNWGEVAGFGTGPLQEAIVWATRPPPAPGQGGRFARTMYLGFLATTSNISKAYAINDELQLGGSGTVSSGLHGMYWQIVVAMTDVGDLSNGTAVDSATVYSVAEGGGHAVGTGLAGAVEHAFLWNYLTRPAIRDLGDLPGGADISHAWDVTRDAAVVGDSGVPMGNHAFVWTDATGMRDLGDLPGGGEGSVAYAIQDTHVTGPPAVLGSILGAGTGASGRRAVGWPAPSAAGTSHGAPIDLNTRLSPANSAVTLTEAKGINRFGIISAKGVTGGVSHVYLLVPSDADVPDASGVTPYQRCTGTLP